MTDDENHNTKSKTPELIMLSAQSTAATTIRCYELQSCRCENFANRWNATCQVCAAEFEVSTQGVVCKQLRCTTCDYDQPLDQERFAECAACKETHAFLLRKNMMLTKVGESAQDDTDINTADTKKRIDTGDSGTDTDHEKASSESASDSSTNNSSRHPSLASDEDDAREMDLHVHAKDETRRGKGILRLDKIPKKNAALENKECLFSHKWLYECPSCPRRVCRFERELFASEHCKGCGNTFPCERFAVCIWCRKQQTFLIPAKKRSMAPNNTNGAVSLSEKKNDCEHPMWLYNCPRCSRDYEWTMAQMHEMTLCVSGCKKRLPSWKRAACLFCFCEREFVNNVLLDSSGFGQSSEKKHFVEPLKRSEDPYSSASSSSSSSSSFSSSSFSCAPKNTVAAVPHPTKCDHTHLDLTVSSQSPTARFVTHCKDCGDTFPM